MKFADNLNAAISNDFHKRALRLSNDVVPLLFREGDFIGVIDICNIINNLVTIALLLKEKFPLTPEILASGHLPAHLHARQTCPSVVKVENKLRTMPVGTVVPSSLFKKEHAQKSIKYTATRLAMIWDVINPYKGPIVNQRPKLPYNLTKSL
jgi:hypothetical protein